MALILPYRNVMPKIADNVYIAPNATIIGDVTIMEGASIWFNAVIRGDFQPIVIGKYTNVQDNATVHVMGDKPTEVGDYVTIGHNTVIHCGHIGDNSLIGMGTILLGYTQVGKNCIIGAGTMLTQHKRIPDNSLIYGNPSRIIRSLRDDEIAAVRESAERYYHISLQYKKQG